MRRRAIFRPSMDTSRVEHGNRDPVCLMVLTVSSKVLRGKPGRESQIQMGGPGHQDWGYRHREGMDGIPHTGWTWTTLAV